MENEKSEREANITLTAQNFCIYVNIHCNLFNVQCQGTQVIADDMNNII